MWVWVVCRARGGHVPQPGGEDRGRYPMGGAHATDPFCAGALANTRPVEADISAGTQEG